MNDGISLHHVSQMGPGVRQGLTIVMYSGGGGGGKRKEREIVSGVREKLKRATQDILAASPRPPVNRPTLCTLGYLALSILLGLGL